MAQEQRTKKLLTIAMIYGALLAAAGCSQTPDQSAEKPIPVPDTGMVIEPDWGQPEGLNTTAARPWPAMNVTYVNGTVTHNPTYMHDLDEPLEYRDRPPTFTEEMIGFANVPWFYVNLGITPILMCFQPPLMQVYSTGVAPESIYSGYLPAPGYSAPVPEKGQVSQPQSSINASTDPVDAATAASK